MRRNHLPTVTHMQRALPTTYRNLPWISTPGTSSLSHRFNWQVVRREDGVASCSAHSGKGPGLTHGSAGLQTLLLRDKVVAVA